jgi:transcriptional regulator with XRE-family HTH domain
MNLHRPTISEIEAGNRRVSAEELSTLANMFDVSVAWLVGEASETVETDDPRIQLAARELRKLRPEDLDRLMRLLASMRSPETSKAKRGGKS